MGLCSISWGDNNMKIEFRNEKEKEVLKHILSDWLINIEEDVLGCEPACRNLTSPSCAHCIKETVSYALDKEENHEYLFDFVGGEDFLLNCKIGELEEDNDID